MFRGSVINDAKVLRDGSQEVGVATVTLPDIENKTEEITGLGLGTYEEVIDGLYNALNLEIKFSGVHKENLLNKGKAVNLTMAAVVQGLDSQTHMTEYQKIMVTAVGKVKSAKFGEVSRGGKLEPGVTMALTYYKVEVNGVIQHEIDVLNGVAVVDGEDIKSEINKLLGR